MAGSDEDHFEDILESRGYVAVEDQEIVAYAAVPEATSMAYIKLRWQMGA